MDVAIPGESATCMASGSAPGSPRRYFTSAPSSPSRVAALLLHLDDPPPADDPDDFAFHFNGGSSPLTAAELFDHGVIRPLKPPPRLQSQDSTLSPRSPKSPPSRFLLSPRRRPTPPPDPFAAAFELARGRDLAPPPPGRRRAARSLSPLRRLFPAHEKAPPPPPAGSRRWRLKDLLLFRSASEGRVARGGADKDPVSKYTAMSAATVAMIAGDAAKGGSFRAAAHARHYAANRAAAEEMRRKTPLPYKQNVFGFLSFNPALSSLSKRFSAFRCRHE
ncbi:uncharacterized protein LOC144704666 [Wolffia australiana]